MNFVLFSGSLRVDSINKKLIIEINSLLSEHSAYKSMVVDLKKFSIPVYNGDIEAAGIPEGVSDLGRIISRADALIIASPEYNGSIAGALKNVIDWLSRLKPCPLIHKPILITGTSEDHNGSISGLESTRSPFLSLGCYVYPQMFGLPNDSDAFLPTGDLASEVTKKKLNSLIEEFAEFSEKLKKH